MTTATKTRGLKSSRSVAHPLAPTLGPWVCAWIERYLVHSEGDYYGQPFRLRQWQKAFIYRAYELQQDGSRRYNRALLGLPKGNGKTELCAAIALAELAGPVVFAGWDSRGRPIARPRVAPDIPVAAASFEQADTLFGSARRMVTAGPLADHLEVYDTEILPKDGPGRLYRVAAVAGTNDGRRPTFFVADELHEWTGNKERVHLVLSNGRAKRADAWELAITTAGWDITSLLGRLYMHGKRVQAGEEEDPRFLFVWMEAPEDLDLEDPEQLREAIRIANPAAGDFLPVENIVQRYYELKDGREHEFRRYYLNQWTTAPTQWIPHDRWMECARPDRQVADGERIVIGFDGSYNRDATAVVGATLEPTPHLFVIGAWERPELAREWEVDALEVMATIMAACERWRVEAVACDPHRWQHTMQEMQRAGLPVVKWPSHSGAVMAPACMQFEEAVYKHALTHDGDERLARHIQNAVVKTDPIGRRITKETRDSPRKIDLAVAAVIAFDMAMRRAPEPELSWRPL